MKQRGFEFVSRIKETERLESLLPKRSTTNSAGYDFYALEDITIPSFVDKLIKNRNLTLIDNCSRGPVPPFCIKTGIKAYMQEDEVLQLYIRSSFPTKKGLILANSVGIVDSDYYDNKDNEGEIGFLVYNCTPDDIIIRKGEKFGQGVFTKFLKVDNDVSNENERSGGFGSTGN